MQSQLNPEVGSGGIELRTEDSAVSRPSAPRVDIDGRGFGIRAERT